MLWRGSPRSMTCPTIARRIGTASSSQPGCSSATEKATAGWPRSAASKAAPTVPEYVMSAPMLPPALTPETTRSGTGQRRPSSATRTQSDGVPSQASPENPSPKVRGSSLRARRTVMLRATALVSRSGAMVVTSPSPSTARRSTAMPGASMPSSLVRRIWRVTRTILAEGPAGLARGPAGPAGDVAPGGVTLPPEPGDVAARPSKPGPGLL